MWQVVAFLEWKEKWWMNRQNKRGGTDDVVSKGLQEGLSVYAEGQANLQKSLHEHFCMLWRILLVGNGDASYDDSDNRSDEEDDDDEEEDGGKTEGDGGKTKGDVSEEEHELWG